MLQKHEVFVLELITLREEVVVVVGLPRGSGFGAGSPLNETHNNNTNKNEDNRNNNKNNNENNNNERCSGAQRNMGEAVMEMLG